MKKKTRVSRSCKRSRMVSRDLTPTRILLRGLAQPVTRQRTRIVRLRGKVMGVLSLLRRFRPAHRKSATLRLPQVRALFRSANRYTAGELSTHGGRHGPPCPFGLAKETRI